MLAQVRIKLFVLPVNITDHIDVLFIWLAKVLHLSPVCTGSVILLWYIDHTSLLIKNPGWSSLPETREKIDYFNYWNDLFNSRLSSNFKVDTTKKSCLHTSLGTQQYFWLSQFSVISQFLAFSAKCSATLLTQSILSNISILAFSAKSSALSSQYSVVFWRLSTIPSKLLSQLA